MQAAIVINVHSAVDLRPTLHVEGVRYFPCFVLRLLLQNILLYCNFRMKKLVKFSNVGSLKNLKNVLNLNFKMSFVP